MRVMEAVEMIMGMSEEADQLCCSVLGKKPIVMIVNLTCVSVS